MKSEVIALRVFALRPIKVGQGRSRSILVELIQGYGGMHHCVKYCVNQWMKSEVIAITSFVMDGRTHG